jgi:c-di-GMP-binding flagellar brake protein YcgR
MGEGGACVELTERLQAQGTIRVRLQTAKGAIELQAKVVWSRRAGSASGILHGMAFTQIAPQQLESLRELFLSEGLVRHAGVRWPLDLPVTCRPDGKRETPLQGRTGEISRGGLLLRLPEAQAPATRLEVTIHALQESLTVFGDVAWVEATERRTPGELIRHGLRFTSLGPSIGSALGFLLAKPL